MNDFDLHLFEEGTHGRLWEKLGAHAEAGGTRFSVWAPRADDVAVAGDFNRWRPQSLERGPGGIWGGFVEGVTVGSMYKYRLLAGGRELWKADPMALHAERAPGTASIVWDLGYEWRDSDWMQAPRSAADPVAIYEVHLGSWRRVPEEGGRALTYTEIAPLLAAYVKETGFTHVELLPVLEHPFYGSWGYQATGFYAPTSRYGTPQDFMFLVDTLHREGIGVLLDWVPSHLAGDEHGLAEFDGAALYESGREREWDSSAFDFSRPQVRAFLRSSALFWIEKFHVDGLRVDAVASIRQRDGGEAFLRELNVAINSRALMVAEDSSPKVGVTAPAPDGGLGFDLKWDMGWMHDTLDYFTKPPEERSRYHGRLTFRPLYLWHEDWVLPLSHDEVKPPFGSLFSKMPGDGWQKLANLRLLLAWMYAQPGRKLLFMGGEFGQQSEWKHDQSLDWHLLDDPAHALLRNLVGFLNWAYKTDPTLRMERDAHNFEWIDCCDEKHNVVSFLRRGGMPGETLLAVFNFSATPLVNYRVGVPLGGVWREVLNTDATHYGGAGHGNFGGVEASPITWHTHPHSLNLLLPPLGAVWLRPGVV
jgi:1,4-alpha-glucan branching enzyme